MMPRSSAAAAAVLLCAWLQVATRSASGATTANVNRHPTPCPTRAGPDKMVVVLGDDGPYYSWEQCAYNHMRVLELLACVPFYLHVLLLVQCVGVL